MDRLEGEVSCSDMIFIHATFANVMRKTLRDISLPTSNVTRLRRIVPDDCPVGASFALAVLFGLLAAVPLNSGRLRGAASARPTQG
jgi:hypothetical protein